MSGRLTPRLNAEDDIYLQRGSAPCSMLWFIDYSSGYTRRLHDVMRSALEKFRVLDPALAVRFYIARPDDSAGEIAARAAVAAARQDRLVAMHDALFEAGPDYSEELVMTIAGDIGLDMERFAADLHSGQTAQKLAADRASAEASVTLPRAPVLFIDEQLYQGAWDGAAILEAMEKPLGVRIRLASHAFFDWAASAGLVLVFATLAALAVANSPLDRWYEEIRVMAAGFHFGDFALDMTVEQWINDGLMSIFFLIVGIEIKRELHNGELSEPDKAALPFLAALGGMVVPALIYALTNIGVPTIHGWGVPMATDIAFTLGILALLGSRVPTSLKVFVSALAIADDLGAIIVIAVFYGHGFEVGAFVSAIVVFAVMLGLNAGRIYSRVPYLVLGAVLWYFIFRAGLHATLAGVLTALAIPSRPSAEIRGVALQARAIFEDAIDDEEGEARSGLSVGRLKEIVDRLRDPGFHLQHELQSWSNYLILPLFAFFNTGIVIIGASFSLRQPEVLGTVLGLVVGKPLGIFLTVFIAVKMGWARMSSDIGWLQLLGGGCLAGVGFTMSIFIAASSFAGAELQSVKLAILAASTLSALIGTAILLLASGLRRRGH